jgi:hypothetical protein
LLLLLLDYLLSLGLCPNSCSGHGTCIGLADAYNLYHRQPANAITETTYVSGAGTLALDLGQHSGLYSNWDSNSIQMCVCDSEYFGPDCQLKMCPKGDDPLTPDQQDRRIGLRISMSNSTRSIPSGNGASIGIRLYGVTSFIQLPDLAGNASTAQLLASNQCRIALESSSRLGRVLCNYTIVSPSAHLLDITFLSWPSIGANDNNIFPNSGNPLITDFFCDVSRSEIPSSPAHNSTIRCEFFDIEFDNIKGLFVALL